MSSTNCRGMWCLTAGYAGSRSTHILVDGVERECWTRRSAAAWFRGTRVGCGFPAERPLAAPFLFTVVANNNDVAVRATIRCRSKPKPRARATVFTPCWDTPGLALSTLACPMAWARVPVRPTGRSQAQKADWGLRSSISTASSPPASYMTCRLGKASIRQHLERPGQRGSWELAG